MKGVKLIIKHTTTLVKQGVEVGVSMSAFHTQQSGEDKSHTSALDSRQKHLQYCTALTAINQQANFLFFLCITITCIHYLGHESTLQPPLFTSSPPWSPRMGLSGPHDCRHHCSILPYPFCREMGTVAPRQHKLDLSCQRRALGRFLPHDQSGSLFRAISLHRCSG